MPLMTFDPWCKSAECECAKVQITESDWNIIQLKNKHISICTSVIVWERDTNMGAWVVGNLNFKFKEPCTLGLTWHCHSLRGIEINIWWWEATPMRVYTLLTIWVEVGCVHKKSHLYDFMKLLPVLSIMQAMGHGMGREMEMSVVCIPRYRPPPPSIFAILMQLIWEMEWNRCQRNGYWSPIFTILGLVCH